MCAACVCAGSRQDDQGVDGRCCNGTATRRRSSSRRSRSMQSTKGRALGKSACSQWTATNAPCLSPRPPERPEMGFLTMGRRRESREGGREGAYLLCCAKLCVHAVCVQQQCNPRFKQRMRECNAFGTTCCCVSKVTECVSVACSNDPRQVRQCLRHTSTPLCDTLVRVSATPFVSVGEGRGAA